MLLRHTQRYKEEFPALDNTYYDHVHMHLHDSGNHIHEHRHGPDGNHHAKRWERRFELPLVMGMEEAPDLSFLLRLSIDRIEERDGE